MYMTVPENTRHTRVAPTVSETEVIDGGTVGNRYWLNSQPMPMVGRPCTCEIDKLQQQLEKLPVKPSVWLWTNSSENVPEGMRWLRSDPESHAASVGPELDSWILQNPNSWLIVDGRGNRIPKAGDNLEEILRKLPVVVVMIVDNTSGAQPFPHWDFPL